jgi:hypothetical protein
MGDVVDLQVAALGEHLEHSQARPGDPEAPGTQPFRAVHGSYWNTCLGTFQEKGGTRAVVNLMP